MRNTLCILFVCLLQTSNATTYYFSAVSGDDSRSSTQAKNSSTPWKSLSKLNSFFSSLKPGDAVLFKRGETFYGSIVVNKSGTSGSPILIGAYGSGNKPVITSLTTLGNWVSKGSGIYESYNSSLSTTVNNVLLNGAAQQLGRYPNSDAADKGYLIYETHSGTTSITDNQLTSKTNWTGAELVIRGRRWILDRDLISSHSGTKISYKATSSYAPYDKNGYFIQNSIKTLDKSGEWYYNPSSKKISIYLGSNSPKSYTIQAPTKDNLIYSDKFSNIVFDNLSIRGSNASAVLIKNGSNINIQTCEVQLSGKDGIEVKYHENLKIENSTVSNSNNNGINLGYSGDAAVIRNNKIFNSAVVPGRGVSGDNNGIGIMSSGDNSIIEYNEIKNTGYTAIYFNGNNVTIKNNLIDGFCLIKDDGAGIYTHTGSDAAGVNRKVIGNIVLNGKGAPEGTSNVKYIPAEGIYADNNATGIEIRDNTVAGCRNQGVYIHSSYGIKILNNTLFNNLRQLSMIEDKDNSKVRKCTVTDNILFSKLTSQRVSYISSPYDDINLFGLFDNNYYARPLDDDSQIYLDKVKKYEDNPSFLDYKDSVRFEYNAGKTAKTISLNASYKDAKSKTYSGSITLQPYTSIVLIRTGSSTSGKSPAVSITTPAANASFKSGSTIEINATATDDGSVNKVEFYRGTTLLHTEYTAPYSYSWQNASSGNYTLTAKATDNNGNVTTSAGVLISVTSSGSSSYPAVSLTRPAANESFSSGETIYISANANDADGSIIKVEFYQGTTLLHTETKSPYGWKWYNARTGSYTITAKATDNSGKVTTSAAVKISVASNRSINNSEVLIEKNVNTILTKKTLANTADNATFDFSLFPNPAVNTIKVNFSQYNGNKKAFLSIQSISGSLLKSIPVVLSAETFEVDISSLNSGVYIIRLTGDNFENSKKFVKMN